VRISERVEMYDCRGGNPEDDWELLLDWGTSKSMAVWL